MYDSTVNGGDCNNDHDRNSDTDDDADDDIDFYDISDDHHSLLTTVMMLMS